MCSLLRKLIGMKSEVLLIFDSYFERETISLGFGSIRKLFYSKI